MQEIVQFHATERFNENATLAEKHTLDDQEQFRAMSMLRKKRSRLRPSDVPQNELKDGTNPLHVAVKACKVQKKTGSFFILEHPLTSPGWRDEKVLELWKEGALFEVILDQREYGFTSTAPAKRPTRVLTEIPGRSLARAIDACESTLSSNITL